MKEPIKVSTASRATGYSLPTIYLMLKDGRLTLKDNDGVQYVVQDEKYKALLKERSKT